MADPLTWLFVIIAAISTWALLNVVGLPLAIVLGGATALGLSRIAEAYSEKIEDKIELKWFNDAGYDTLAVSYLYPKDFKSYKIVFDPSGATFKKYKVILKRQKATTNSPYATDIGKALIGETKNAIVPYGQSGYNRGSAKTPDMVNISVQFYFEKGVDKAAAQSQFEFRKYTTPTAYKKWDGKGWA